MLAALAAVLVALGFLCAAAYLALLDVFSPATAALLTGLGAIVLALLILAAGRAALRPGARRRRAAESAEAGPGDAATGAGELAGALGERLATIARANPKATLFASLVAGFAVGVSPRLRKALIDLLLPK